MTPAQYWRIKAALLQVELAQEKVRHVVAPAQAALADAIRAAGFDPAGEYRLDDARETLVPVTPEGQGDA